MSSYPVSDTETTDPLYDAFAELASSLRAYFTKYVGAQEREDLLAETWLRLEQNRDVWDRKRPAGPWIRGFARRILAERLDEITRRKELMEERFSGIAGGPVEEGHDEVIFRGGQAIREVECTENPALAIEERESQEILWSCLREVPETKTRFRTVLALHLAEVPLVDIARTLGITHGHATRRLSRARVKLVELVERRLADARRGGERNRPNEPNQRTDAARPAWDWIWSLEEGQDRSAQLLLFGRISWTMLQNFRFDTALDRERIARLDRKLLEAGWAE